MCNHVRNYAVVCFLSFLLVACSVPSSAHADNSADRSGLLLQLYPYLLRAQPGESGDFADPFIGEIADRTWTYLSSDWARSNHLPWSWRSDEISGGDYANTAEMGLLALSWLAAYDLGQDWSPEWETTETEVMAILRQLRDWQTGVQVEQPNGPNAYNNSVFYQWYWINQNPPVVGLGDRDHLVPSIDNTWLAAVLITVRAYARVHALSEMADLADAILTDMDFRLWYDEETALFYWGDIEQPLGGDIAGYYSDENRIVNFVARALYRSETNPGSNGDESEVDEEHYNLSSEEFRRSLDALLQPPMAYLPTDSESEILVEKVAFDGSYFTYTTPALFIKEIGESYGMSTTVPATEIQIAYAVDSGYDVWGLSDSFDVEDGGYIAQGTPPAGKLGILDIDGQPKTVTVEDGIFLEQRPGVVTPHASALAMITPLEGEAAQNLAKIADAYACAYDDIYGFKDSVLSGSAGDDGGVCSDRFSALNQEWLFLALVNHHSQFIWRYFYLDLGVQRAHCEMFGCQIFLPTVQR